MLDLAEWMGCATKISSLFREKGVEIGMTLRRAPLLFVNTTALETASKYSLLRMESHLTNLIPNDPTIWGLQVINSASALRDPYKILI